MSSGEWPFNQTVHRVWEAPCSALPLDGRVVAPTGQADRPGPAFCWPQAAFWRCVCCWRQPCFRYCWGQSCRCVLHFWNVCCMLVHSTAVQLCYQSADTVSSSKTRSVWSIKHKCCACLATEDYMFVACATQSDAAESCQTCLTLQSGLLIIHVVR